ncbi:mitochondrial division protein 1 [Viridothelium virens]|uniref:Mitochondrial division protein 1 n=1 Tax=Viridothelium virens TaxID=1048519 RepID=A0A6A6GWZ1_VIRVR|nr:mitochondrial division protein 1 [Viridothelium virens]
MAESTHGNGSPPRSHGRSRSDLASNFGADDSILGNSLSSRQLEAFGRKVTATAGHLIGPLGEGGTQQHYQGALGDIHRELRRPLIQRSVFALTQSSPREIVRSTLSVPEIQHRALTFLPDELLANIPEDNSTYSLFQGFQATIPEDEGDRGSHHRRRHGRHGSKGQKLIGAAGDEAEETPNLKTLRSEKTGLDRKLEMMAVRKNMCSSEIREIDNKISNLNTMRKLVLDRLANLEQEELEIEHEIHEVDDKLEILEEELEDAAALAQKSPVSKTAEGEDAEEPDSPGMQASFMSESIYQKLPSPKSKRKRVNRRISMPVLHEHLQPGSKIKELPAHEDVISALDFDAPFGTMVTAALDDTVRVWDLNAGRCMGLLEGHLSSVRCLQVEENIVATGSMDATIRLWDLSKADYVPPIPHDNRVNKAHPENDEDDGECPPSLASMADCPLFTLEAHVAEVTALHFKNNTLVSGSADKTLRQWDLEKGRPVQTLDVLWAAAQASAAITPPGSNHDLSGGGWRHTGRQADASADFVGALQCFDAALACGTADGMVRLWDLRSGSVHRSLVGHTGPVTALQFDDVHLVTGSLDRSIRIWDLRTGGIYDAYAYDNPISSMMFDARRIVAAAGENVIKVYDKTDGRHWDCGPGSSVHETISSTKVEHVRIKDGYMIEGRRDGMVGAWSC